MIRECIKKNPNIIITNLTDMKLTENEVSILKNGLKHGLLTWSKENEMVAVVEDI